MAVLEGKDCRYVPYLYTTSATSLFEADECILDALRASCDSILECVVSN